MRALLASAMLLAAACGSHDSAPPQRTPAPASAAASGSGSAPVKPVPTIDPCAALDQAYDDAVAHASGACKSDDECTCFPGGLGAHPTCGGVTDQKSAAAISAIVDQHHTLQCRTSLQCGPARCEPHCAAGRCQ